MKLPRKAFEVILLKPNEKVFVEPEVTQLKPNKMYVLPTGSKKDRTSFVMELGVDDTTVVVTQITLEMLISNMDIKTRAHLLQELAI